MREMDKYRLSGSTAQFICKSCGAKAMSPPAVDHTNECEY